MIHLSKISKYRKVNAFLETRIAYYIHYVSITIIYNNPWHYTGRNEPNYLDVLGDELRKTVTFHV